MPVALENKLRARIERQHPEWSQARKDAYVYAVLRRTGWKPGRERD